jgi:riboflavin biosynthesis pyrimidine reductase
VQPEDVRTPADVTTLGRALLGEDPALTERVLHVVSVWRGDDGPPRVLRIGPKTPKSQHDRFLLALSRARAEAIVTTGRILREEPALTHGPIGPAPLRAALTAWRRERLGLMEPPWLVVLSSGRDLDPTHPAFHGPTRALLFVPDGAAAGLRARFVDTAAHVASVASPSIRLALDHLRGLGANRITIEAGPTSTRALYDPPAAVDELWRATYLGRRPDPAVIGEPFAEDERCEAALPYGSEPARCEEPSGAWSFERRSRLPG